MYGFFIALAIIGNFFSSHELFRGSDRPVKVIWSNVAGARGLRNVINAFDCIVIGRWTYRGYSEELRNVLNAAGFDVYHLGNGIFTIDRTSAQNKEMRETLSRYGQIYFAARLTETQRKTIGLATPKNTQGRRPSHTRKWR